MEEGSIIIPVFNSIGMTKRCIDHIKETNEQGRYEIIIVDNGSTDGTPEVLSKEEGITYVRIPQNLGISKAFNQGSRAAKNNILFFMHNDLFVYEENWIKKIIEFISKTPRVGIVGLYGAKTILRSGQVRGKTIVHSKVDAPAIEKQFERVAEIDGVLMALKKDVFEKVSGFNENFPYHCYHKDFSLKVLNRQFNNYVINIPFKHFCGTTRKGIKDESQIRTDALRRFAEQWKDHLPVDVSTWRDKFRYMLKW